MVGAIKVLRTERRSGRLRLHFAAGGQALDHFQRYQAIVTEVSCHFSTEPDAVAALVVQQSEQLRAAQREVERLRAELLPVKAKRLAGEAETVGPLRLVCATFSERSAQELRTLASLLQTRPGVVALLAGYDGQELALAVGCADDTGISANRET